VKLALALAALLLAPSPAQPCALAGNMRFVQRDATYKVFVTSRADADAHAKLVPHQATRAGEWRPVDPGIPVAFTVQVVSTRDQADFSVRFVEFPRACP
jgi:hypothetical protein